MGRVSGEVGMEDVACRERELLLERTNAGVYWLRRTADGSN